MAELSDDDDELVPFFDDDFVAYEEYPAELDQLHADVGILSKFSLGRLTFQVFRDIGSNVKYHIKKYRTGDDLENYTMYSVGSLRMQSHLTECCVIPVLDCIFDLRSGPRDRTRYSIALGEQDQSYNTILSYEATSFEQVRRLWPVDMYKTDFLCHQRFQPGESPRYFGTVALNEACMAIAPHLVPFTSKEKRSRTRAVDVVSHHYAWGGDKVHDTVTDLVKLHVSPEHPFVIKIMKSGNVVWEFCVQRWDRANEREAFIPMNAQV